MIVPILILVSMVAAAAQSGVAPVPETPATSQVNPEPQETRRSRPVPVRAVAQMIRIFVTSEPSIEGASEPTDPEAVFREQFGRGMPEEDFQIAVTTLRQSGASIDAIRDEAQYALTHFEIDGIVIYDTAFMQRLGERRQRVYLDCAAKLEKRLSPKGWAVREQTMHERLVPPAKEPRSDSDTRPAP